MAGPSQACVQCANAHRILHFGGTISPDFAWTDANDLRNPVEMREGEGLSFTNAMADKARQLTADDLAALTGDQNGVTVYGGWGVPGGVLTRRYAVELLLAASGPVRSTPFGRITASLLAG